MSIIKRLFGYNPRKETQEDVPYSVDSSGKKIKVDITGEINVYNTGRLYEDIMGSNDYLKPIVLSFEGRDARITIGGFGGLLNAMKDKKQEKTLLVVTEDNASFVMGARDIAGLGKIVAVYKRPQFVREERRVAA